LVIEGYKSLNKRDFEMSSTAVVLNSDPSKSPDPVICPANRCTYLTVASRRIIDIAFCRRRTPANKVEPMNFDGTEAFTQESKTFPKAASANDFDTSRPSTKLKMWSSNIGMVTFRNYQQH